ncbi:hypothetical protein KUTeg_017201 [Tegillarca granosa]|uniref:Inositol polyphosphate-related phosphatase domain-containing protein n=1 Tax=Tegillarca granosa TaxID=220873 RepID=A0ABQ9EIY3_TEGGR|nr:hypothetical protein KUTeg_017201 [Tegillarca granosa]
MLKHGKTAMKMTLSIDIQAGKLFAVKPTKESLDSKILQLVKSTKDMSRLDMIINSNKKYTYSFENVHTRENFCQQIMQMKNLHSAGDNVDQISVFIGTWNMGDNLPHNSINSWLKCSGCGKPRETEILGCLPHDLYVVGTQESAMTEKDWVNFLKNHLKSCVMSDLEVVEVCTLWGIRLVILTKKQYQHCISRIQRSTVRTGIANALGKAISGTSFCFINAHLTSGDERIERRNQNYRDILKGLSLGQKHLDLFGITNQFHHVFWLGDLNYRVEEKIQTILTKLTEKDIQYLLSKDQLKKTQGEKKGFCGFNEADITFMPTYRLPRSEVCWKYDWKKERINAPSWCDRVLWRSYPGTYIENIAYGCAESVLGSDHRPVFASFNIGITSDFVMNRDSLIEADSPVKIVFQQIRPLFGDQEFLEEQHILIAVRTKDGDHESYGECVVPLKNTFDLMPQEFEYQLLHQGEVTGKIKGQMHVLSGKNLAARRNSKKSYELIALDTEYIDPTTWHSDSPSFMNKNDTSTSVMDRNRSAQHSTLTATKSGPTLSEDRPPAVIPRDAEDSTRPYVNVGPSGGGDYLENFIKNGFDSISFISGISRSDLVAIGIDNSDHRDRIINNRLRFEFFPNGTLYDVKSTILDGWDFPTRNEEQSKRQINVQPDLKNPPPFSEIPLGGVSSIADHA